MKAYIFTASREGAWNRRETGKDITILLAKSRPSDIPESAAEVDVEEGLKIKISFDFDNMRAWTEIN